MAKLLRVRDYILLACALVGEAADNIRLVGGIAPDLLKARYGFVPPNFRKRSYAATVSRMLSTGDINRVIDKDGKTYLQLTGSGNEKFKRRFPVSSLIMRKWDGYFMQVIFDIPEIERGTRDTLRKKLRELGFGMLQESVWISPYHFEDDLREFLVNEGLGEKVFILEAKAIRAGNFKYLANRIWNLDHIRGCYQEVIDRTVRLKKQSKINREEEVKAIWELYLSTIKSDPKVPEEILTTPIKRQEAAEAISKLF